MILISLMAMAAITSGAQAIGFWSPGNQHSDPVGCEGVCQESGKYLPPSGSQDGQEEDNSRVARYEHGLGDGLLRGEERRDSE